MPDLLAGWLPEGLSVLGLMILIVATLISGVVYGFAGFGSALLFLPVAVRVIPLEVAIAAFNITALASLFTVLPRAWADVDRPAVTLMIVCATVSASLGILVLRTVDVTLLQWSMLAVVAGTLVALISGWRLRAEPTMRARGLVSLAAGFLGGAVGLLGPAVVVFQLAGRDGAARNRATTAVFLTLSTLLVVPLLALQGLITWSVVPLGLILLIPYGVGTQIGQMMFRPEAEALYRRVAYLLIALAVLLGLPLFD